MNEKIAKINREKGFTYTIDKEGNVIKGEYSIFKDKWTLVTIAILILAGAYYLQMKSSLTNEQNFVPACNTYQRLFNAWIIQNPNEPVPELRELMKYSIDSQGKLVSHGELQNG